MNKQTTYILLLACSLCAILQAQDIQEISTGAGYQKQSFINLATGTEKQVANTAWDIAFTVLGALDAGVLINESAGTSMGQPQSAIELYDALTDDFAAQPDPAALEDFSLLNAEKTWSYGAFNEVRDPDNAFDYGWGTYDLLTHEVSGNRVYVIKLHNGTFRKIQILSLAGTTYTFKYAELDGSNEVTKTVDKAAYPGKTLAYFNLETGNSVDVEPASGGFDLLYCRYTTPLFDPGSQGYIPYSVTGILSGAGVQVAKADGVDPATVAYNDWKDSLHTELNVIGYDWKSFSGTAWSLDEDRVYFVQTADKRVWKLHFFDFEGSTTGTAVFEKTDLGIISAVKAPAALGLQLLAYPNPVVDQLELALDVPAAFPATARLQVIDMQGRMIADEAIATPAGFQVREIAAATWASGMYQVQLVLANTVVPVGRVVKQ